MSTLIYYSVPAFVLLLVTELVVTRLRAVREHERLRVLGYEPRDTAASLAMGIGNVVIAAGTKFAALALYAFAYEFRLFDIPMTWWSWALILIGDDFCYYWFHRIHHEVRLFWAAHVNHHSSRYFNLSTALRQSWTTPFTGPIFWLPLALLGFHPAMILTAQAISLLYQFWIHTELIDRMGWFERVFNTPSHHRVHHGRNVEYLDRNYAGILIVWDKLFGTFEPERAPVDYGITKNLDTFHPVVIAFHDWREMIQQVRAAPTLRAKLAHVFAPPGWSADGSTRTAREMQAERETRREGVAPASV